MMGFVMACEKAKVAVCADLHKAGLVIASSSSIPSSHRIRRPPETLCDESGTNTSWEGSSVMCLCKVPRR